MKFKRVHSFKSNAAFYAKNSTKSAERILGEMLANKVRNEINAGICKQVAINGSERCEQLEGLDKQRFEARLLIKKYKRYSREVCQFAKVKYLTEKQCAYVKHLVRKYKREAAIRIQDQNASVKI